MTIQIASAGAMSSTATPTAPDMKVSVRFAPDQASAGPLDRLGSGIVSELKRFDASRGQSAKASAEMGGGPASAFDTVRAQLTSGPASGAGTVSIGPAGANVAPSASGDPVDRALSAMTRSFDYAIETQLIVKTGSQLSTSASSLMRGS